jgi:hypothetical protein
MPLFLSSDVRGYVHCLTATDKVFLAGVIATGELGFAGDADTCEALLSRGLQIIK